MPFHPAFAQNRTAVITGAASGIGLAAAEKYARLGMNVCMADVNAAALEHAAAGVAALASGADKVLAVATDVSEAEDVERLKRAAYSRFGEVAVLMNNAGTEGGGSGLFGQRSRWEQIIGVNLWGVVNGIQAFVPAMRAQGTDCTVISTGSKQGITCPPGDTAYNVSKAGLKVVTEALAHELRNFEGCRVSAHLLIPGFVFTGFTRKHTSVRPAAAWMPEQVIDFMLEKVALGDFYILCPDNDVPRALDEKRMEWAMGDIIHNRPPLSRWHKDYKERFSEFLKEDEEQAGG